MNTKHYLMTCVTIPLLSSACITGASSAVQPTTDAFQPAIYYVDSERGDDANDGTSLEMPFLTLQRGVNALNRRGGDTLVLRGEFRETLNLSWINYGRNGEALTDRTTTVRCAVDEGGGAPSALIDGGIPPRAESFPFDCRGKQPGFGPDKDNRYLDRGVIIAQCNHVLIDGIAVRGIAGLGVLMWRASHVTLCDVTVEWISQSALMLSHGRHHDPATRNLTVEYCRVNQSNLGLWRDRHNPDPRRRGYEMRSETVSIVKWDGFRVHHNHVSNSLMEGIDFKVGSRNGEIHHNLVEQCRSAGIYANEGRDTKIFRNVVRRIGYYDPQDGSGLHRGGEYLSKNIPGSKIGEPGATGILISTGDLDGPGRPPLEVGHTSGIEVYENVIAWTRKAAVSVWNEWRKEGRPGWVLDDIRIDNNTCFRTCLGPNPVSAAILFDAGATSLRIRNNIIVGSDKFDMELWDRPGWPQSPTQPQRIITHNLFHKNAQKHTQGEHSILADPLFVDEPATIEANGDLQIRDDSSARDAGVNTDLPCFGDTRKDIGAYEFGLPAWRTGDSH